MNPEDLEHWEPMPPDRPGPFNVEIAEIAGHWDSLATTDDFLEACHAASYLVRRDWRVRQRQDRVQILDGNGSPC